MANDDYGEDLMVGRTSTDEAARQEAYLAFGSF